MNINPIPTYKQLGYIDNCIKQTLLWINGKSEHRNDECTIDFSCCYPLLKWGHERRSKVGSEKLEELHQRRYEALTPPAKESK